MKSLKLLAVHKVIFERQVEYRNLLDSIQEVVRNNYIVPLIPIYKSKDTIRRDEVNSLIAKELKLTLSPKLCKIIHTALEEIGIKKTILYDNKPAYRGIKHK